MSVSSLLDDIGFWVVVFFESMMNFAAEHPLLTILLIVVSLIGGCGIAVKVHIISSSTKLMPY